MSQKLILTSDKDDICKLLEAHIQSGNLNFLFGSGASVPAINVAGTIESDINTLLQQGKDSEADTLSLEFIEKLESVNKKIVSDNADNDIKETLINYSDFLEIVDRLLFERKNLLLPRQANLFTTNYDFFFERAASNLPTVILNDGFDRTVVKEKGFPFAPEKYFDRIFRSGNVYDRQAEVPSINLIKIHGSLTWNRDLHEGISFSTEGHTPLSEEEKKDAKLVRDSLMNRVVILPNIRKFESTMMDRVYFDLLRLYSNSLDKENALIIAFGFSFADEHILDVTRRALRNPTAKLIIFAYSHAGALTFEEKFKRQRNVLIIAPDEGDNISFSDLNKLLGEIVPIQQIDHE